MNKGILAVFVLFAFSACNSNKIKVKGIISEGSGKKIFLREMAQSNIITTDSAIITPSGSFELKGQAQRPAFYLLSLSSHNYITLVIKPGEVIKVNANALSLKSNCQIEGSDDNLLIRELTAKLDETLSKIGKLRETYEDSIHSINILNIRHQLDSAYDVIEREHRQYTQTFITKNIESLASLMALYQQLSPKNSVLTPSKDFRYYKMVDSSMMQKYPEVDAVQSLHSLIYDLADQQKRIQELEDRVGVGAIAPEIALPGPNGNVEKLSNNLGKWVYLEFWASWCAPCRAENPELLNTFWRYKAKGFTVFQVSLDKSHESWVKAIRDDKLTQWKHCSDLQMWNSTVVPLYGVEATPTGYLLDPSGKIIMKNIRVADLKIKLKEVFGY